MRDGLINLTCGVWCVAEWRGIEGCPGDGREEGDGRTGPWARGWWVSVLLSPSLGSFVPRDSGEAWRTENWHLILSSKEKKLNF